MVEESPNSKQQCSQKAEDNIIEFHFQETTNQMKNGVLYNEKQGFSLSDEENFPDLERGMNCCENHYHHNNQALSQSYNGKICENQHPHFHNQGLKSCENHHHHHCHNQGEGFHKCADTQCNGGKNGDVCHKPQICKSCEKPGWKKPPRHPKTPGTNSKEKYLKGISDPALIRRAKLQKLRRQRLAKAAASSSSSSSSRTSLLALLVTLAFCAVMILQGIFFQQTQSHSSRTLYQAPPSVTTHNSSTKAFLNK